MVRMDATGSVILRALPMIADTLLLSPKAILAPSSPISSTISAPPMIKEDPSSSVPPTPPEMAVPTTKPATLQVSFITTALVSSFLNVSPASL